MHNRVCRSLISEFNFNNAVLGKYIIAWIKNVQNYTTILYRHIEIKNMCRIYMNNEKVCIMLQT